MPLLTRDQILNAEDIKTEEVDVPEWGGTVRVTTLSGVDRDRLEAAIVTLKGKKAVTNLENLRARLVSMTVVDESGNLIFTPNDILTLGSKSGSALQRVFEVASRLAGLSEEDVDELTKN